MSGIASSTARALVAACDILNVVESIDKMDRAQERNLDSTWETASVVHRLVLLGFTCIEIGMLLNGSKPEKLAILKRIELLPRSAGMFIELELQKSNMDGTTRNIVRVLSKGLIAPFADMFRVNYEESGYQAQAYLETHQTNPTAQMPVYKLVCSGEDCYMELAGYKPIDPLECRETIQSAITCANIATSVRVVCEKLERFLSPTILQQHHAAQESIEWHDLLALQRIPLPLHDDVVFKQYVCPITCEPIRDPVRDPNGYTLYERAAIYNWLRGDSNRGSPATRRPMAIEDLQEVPAVRALIDTRLQFHQQNLMRFLQKTAELPADAHTEEIAQEAVSIPSDPHMTQYYGLSQAPYLSTMGNCLFQAMTLSEPSLTQIGLRTFAVTRVRSDFDLQQQIVSGIGNIPLKIFNNSTQNFEDYFYASLEDYDQKMRQNLTQGTEIEIRAIARLLGRPIYLITEGNQFDRVYEGYLEGDPLFLEHKEGHYALLTTNEGQNARNVAESIAADISTRAIHHPHEGQI